MSFRRLFAITAAAIAVAAASTAYALAAPLGPFGPDYWDPGTGTVATLPVDGTLVSYEASTSPDWLSFDTVKGKAYTLTLSRATPIMYAPKPSIYHVGTTALGWQGWRLPTDGSRQLVFVAPADESVHLSMGDFARSSGSYQVSMQESDPRDVTWFYDAYEPDNTTDTAEALPADGTPQTRHFWDVDWIKVPVRSGRYYHVEMAWVRFPGWGTTWVDAYDDHGQKLCPSENLGRPGQNFHATYDGFAYFKIYDQTGVNGADYTARAWESTGSDITGVVRRSPGGTPVAGAGVALFRRYSTGPVAVASTTTTTDGSYSLDAYPDKSYYVAFTDPTAQLFGEWSGGWTLAMSQPPTDTPLAPGTKIVVDGHLHEPAGVEGMVHDLHGGPVSGATVQLQRWFDIGAVWGTVAQITTGDDGSYRFAGVDPTSVRRLVVQMPDQRLQISDPSLMLSDGATASVDVTVASRAAITGTITDPHAMILPSAQFLVTVRRAGAPATVVASTRVTSPPYAYQVTGLDPGTYVVRVEDLTCAYPSLWYGAGPFSGSASPMAASWDDTITVDVAVGGLAGGTRYDTALSVSRSAFGTGSCDAVVIATGRTFPDALGAAGLAGAARCPILLVNGTSATLDPGVRDEIARLTRGRASPTAYIVGGTGAVSAGIEAGLRNLVGRSGVVRLGGATRYDTADAIAVRARAVLKAKGVAYSGAAICVSGSSYADALLAAPVAFSRRIPILLMGPVGRSLTATMSAVGVRDVCVIGSRTSVTTATCNALAVALGGSGHVTRPCAEVSPYRQSVAVADWATSTQGLTWQRVGIATGSNYPDALAAGSSQGLASSPLLLTPSASADPDVVAALAARKSAIDGLRFYGGTSAVAQRVRDAMSAVLR